MKYKRLKLSVLLISVIVTGLQAQEATVATGGNALGNSGSVSYTVGQVAYITCDDINTTIAAGVQQPYEITIATTIEETEGVNLSFCAYPNPINDFLTLSINEFNLSNLSYSLYDMNGKILLSKKIAGKLTRIFMGNLTPATYHLKIIQGCNMVKTFKIIKT